MNKRVRIPLKSAASHVLGVTFLAVIFIAAPTHAAGRPAPAQAGSPGSPDPNTFNLGYFDVSEPPSENGIGAGDNFVHLINPTAANGSLCALIYVYDDDQEQGECCGCPVTPNELLTLSVENQLTSNWALNTPDTDSGVVAIFSALPNNPTCLNPNGTENFACNGGCDPTTVFTGVPTLTPALVGSILRKQTIGTLPATVTETNMFQASNGGTVDEQELGFALLFCFTNVTNGSGHGVCSCGAGKAMKAGG